MQTWQMILIAIIVFAIIIGNIALIKHSANMPFKKVTKTNSNPTANTPTATAIKKP